MLSLIGLLIAAFMLYFPYEWCRFKNENEKEFGLKWFMTKKSVLDVIICLAITLIPLTIISMHWPIKYGGPGPHHPEFLRALDNLGGGIAAAFIEETFFRGFIQTLIARYTKNNYFAIFITSIFFALSHLVVIRGWMRVATFFPGLIMGWLRYRGESVMPSIIYHAICNIWAVWWAPII